LDNADINYNEKIKHLIETWQFAHGLITMAGPELVPKILHWAVRHILHLMLLVKYSISSIFLCIIIFLQIRVNGKMSVWTVKRSYTSWLSRAYQIWQPTQHQ
jgi:hypothetical protein